jgi:LysM repeat protein
MWNKNTPQKNINQFNQRKQFFPIFISILASLLVLIGIVILVLWLSGGGISFNLFKGKQTATQTSVPTPVLSPTPSLAPTLTATQTPPITPTPSGPFEYEVKQDDTCWGLAVKFKADFEALLAINGFTNGTCPIYPGLKILIPAPGATIPTQTPINPAEMTKGTKINYTVQSGDTLATIAGRFNSTIADILALNKNKFTDANNIPIGIVLVIRVNLVTPTPTFAPTSTRSS